MDVERHDVSFTERIDRRIGNLRETLFAVIPERAWERGKERGRGVVAHAPVGFFAVDESGEKSLELIFGPARSRGDALGLGCGLGRCGGGKRQVPRAGAWRCELDASPSASGFRASGGKGRSSGLARIISPGPRRWRSAMRDSSRSIRPVSEPAIRRPSCVSV